MSRDVVLLQAATFRLQGLLTFIRQLMVATFRLQGLLTFIRQLKIGRCLTRFILLAGVRV